MAKPNGTFIVFEGGDGVGKSIQAALLAEALAANGAVTSFKFPRKETAFGALVYECLDGYHGDFLELSPYLASLPYAIDQAIARRDLEVALSKGHVVCDRYVGSNLAFQAAKCSGSMRRKVIEFIEHTTHDDLGALRPDLVIYLDVPADVSSGLVGAKKDQHEEDLRYQEVVRGTYRMLAQERPEWRTIQCMKGSALRSPQDIRQEIFELVQEIV